MFVMLPTPPWLQSILEEHFEEIQMLWELRGVAVRDPAFKTNDLRELDERISANADGLLIGRAHAQKMLLAGLVSGELSAVFAATFVLLRFGDPLMIDEIVKVLSLAEDEPTIDGIAEAFTLSPIKPVEAILRNLLSHSGSAVAAVALEALAFHGKLESDNARLTELLLDDLPYVRRRSWSIVSCLGK